MQAKQETLGARASQLANTIGITPVMKLTIILTNKSIIAMHVAILQLVISIASN